MGSPDRYTNIHLIIGPRGDGTHAGRRVLVCLRFRPTPDGGSLMVIDAGGRRSSDPPLFARSLHRDEVIGTPLAPQVFLLVDALWLTEPRIEAVKALCQALPHR